MKHQHLDPRVDTYVESAAEFARPLLRHLRGLIHQASPEVVETIKWSRPFFLHRGHIVANLAAFKAHCSVNLWGPGMKTLAAPLTGPDPGPALARLTSPAGLPSDAVLLAWLKAAFQAAATVPGSRPTRAPEPRPEIDMPEDLAGRLAAVPEAADRFAALSPSCRQEYIEWITEAKRAGTRQRRIAEAVAWIAEGKRRNWKYEAGSPSATGTWAAKS